MGGGRHWRRRRYVIYYIFNAQVMVTRTPRDDMCASQRWHAFFMGRCAHFYVIHLKSNQTNFSNLEMCQNSIDLDMKKPRIYKTSVRASSARRLRAAARKYSRALHRARRSVNEVTLFFRFDGALTQWRDELCLFVASIFTIDGCARSNHQSITAHRPAETTELMNTLNARVPSIPSVLLLVVA